MTGYRVRAPWYGLEFSTLEDRGYLERELRTVRPSEVMEIPAGAGRLVSLHREGTWRAILVDLEPEMVRLCRKTLGDNARIAVDVGDIATLVPSPSVDCVLIPHGGLQVLREGIEPFSVLSHLADGAGVRTLYVDVALPWTVSHAEENRLPKFMRRCETSGRELFSHQSLSMRRDYEADWSESAVNVSFKYSVRDQIRDRTYEYDASACWRRIDPEGTRAALLDAGFEVEVHSWYDRSTRHDGAARALIWGKR